MTRAGQHSHNSRLPRSQISDAGRRTCDDKYIFALRSTRRLAWKNKASLIAATMATHSLQDAGGRGTTLNDEGRNDEGRNDEGRCRGPAGAPSSYFDRVLAIHRSNRDGCTRPPSSAPSANTLNTQVPFGRGYVHGVRPSVGRRPQRLTVCCRKKVIEAA
jgi:hypothetical protein